MNLAESFAHSKKYEETTWNEYTWLNSTQNTGGQLLKRKNAVLVRSEISH